MILQNDMLPVLALYERYRDGEVFLTGAFGGVRLFIHPIAGADPDDRSWRLYVAPRLQGIDKDPTTLTKPAPTGWAGVRERQGMPAARRDRAVHALRRSGRAPRAGSLR
jgi:hypothetical protein